MSANQALFSGKCVCYSQGVERLLGTMGLTVGGSFTMEFRAEIKLNGAVGTVQTATKVSIF